MGVEGGGGRNEGSFLSLVKSQKRRKKEQKKTETKNETEERKKKERKRGGKKEKKRKKKKRKKKRKEKEGIFWAYRFKEEDRNGQALGPSFIRATKKRKREKTKSKLEGRGRVSFFENPTQIRPEGMENHTCPLKMQGSGEERLRPKKPFQHQKNIVLSKKKKKEKKKRIKE